jgi:hypothetical protein
MSGQQQFPLDEFELYNLARAFRVKTYRLVRQLPEEERYCLEKQMRRAAVSVTNNIAEGQRKVKRVRCHGLVPWWFTLWAT